MPVPKKNNKHYKIVAAANEAEIFIYDEVSPWGVAASELVKEIKELNVSLIKLRLNSPGGVVTEGFAIYNALLEHNARVVAYVDGVAASIATVIALAADEVNIADNAFFMIHNPTSWAHGGVEELEKMAEILKKMTDNIVKIYKGKTGLDEEEIRDLMDKETWLTADEAIEKGFADNVFNLVGNEEEETEKAGIDLSMYNHVPAELLQRIAAKIPHKRTIEKGLRDVGLSQKEAKAATAIVYDKLTQRDAEEDAQRDAEEVINININTNNKGDITMHKCIHCGLEHTTENSCQCPNAIADRLAVANAGGSPTPAASSAPVTGSGDGPDVLALERTKTKEIVALGELHNMTKEANEFLASGKSAQEFKDVVLEKIANKVPDSAAPVLGMSGKDIKRFSMTKAILELSTNKPVTGLEKEMSDATAKLIGRDAQGFFLPHDVAIYDIRNDLSGGVGPAGGYTIGEDVLGGSFIELLTNSMKVKELGATMLTGLVGDIAIPKQTGGATSYWLADDGAPNESDQTFGQIVMKPKTVGAMTDIGRSLLLQSSIDVEALVRMDIARSIALGIDLAAINGSGNTGEPLGILNTTGIGSISWAADNAPVFGEFVNMETEVATDNALLGNLAYLTTAAIAGFAKQTPKATNTGIMILENNMINGYNAAVSQQVPLGKAIFGNWSDLLIAMWGALDILVDPYTGGAAGTIRIRALQSVDVAPRHAESFSEGTN
jgi:HK97 family phage major capsid protein